MKGDDADEGLRLCASLTIFFFGFCFALFSFSFLLLVVGLIYIRVKWNLSLLLSTMNYLLSYIYCKY